MVGKYCVCNLYIFSSLFSFTLFRSFPCLGVLMYLFSVYIYQQLMRIKVQKKIDPKSPRVFFKSIFFLYTYSKSPTTHILTFSLYFKIIKFMYRFKDPMTQTSTFSSCCKIINYFFCTLVDTIYWLPIHASNGCNLSLIRRGHPSSLFADYYANQCDIFPIRSSPAFSFLVGEEVAISIAWQIIIII